MALQTRKPTGLPSWPIMLLAGREGAGKSWAAASASASEHVARTLWIGIGEDDPDEYGAIEGADFEIVQHDGTYRGILGAVRDAVAEPVGAKPTLIVVDSLSRLWDLIKDNAQVEANKRRRGKPNTEGDYSISMDLWNIAAAQFTAIIEALRLHQGPSIVTARLDETVVMDAEGKPTKDRVWKIQGHKSLPFEASIIVQLRERGSYLVTKVKSARYPLAGELDMPGFEVGDFWSRLGLGDVQAGERRHADTVSDDVADEAAVADAITEVSIMLRDAKTPADVSKAQARAQEVGLTPDSVIDEASTTLIELFNAARSRLQPVASGPSASESQPMALAGTES